MNGAECRGLILFSLAITPGTRSLANSLTLFSKKDSKKIQSPALRGEIQSVSRFESTELNSYKIILLRYLSRLVFSSTGASLPIWGILKTHRWSAGEVLLLFYRIFRPEPIPPSTFQGVNITVTHGNQLTCQTGTGCFVGSGAIENQGLVFCVTG